MISGEALQLLRTTHWDTMQTKLRRGVQLEIERINDLVEDQVLREMHATSPDVFDDPDLYHTPN